MKAKAERNVDKARRLEKELWDMAGKKDALKTECGLLVQRNAALKNRVAQVQKDYDAIERTAAGYFAVLCRRFGAEVGDGVYEIDVTRNVLNEAMAEWLVGMEKDEANDTYRLRTRQKEVIPES